MRSWSGPALRNAVMRYRDRTRLWCFRAALDEYVEAAPPQSAADAEREDRLPRSPTSPWPGSGTVGLAAAEMSDCPRGAVPVRRLSYRYEEYDLGDEADQAEAAKRGGCFETPSLHPALSRDELRRIRRDFASRAHPDRAPLHLRQQAVEHMARINAMIDQALRSAAH